MRVSLLWLSALHFCFQIPKEVGSLTSLASLDVSHNDQLSTLPDEMGRLSKLWEVTQTDKSFYYLSYNDQLSMLPDEMGRLSKLWEVTQTDKSFHFTKYKDT